MIVFNAIDVMKNGPIYSLNESQIERIINPVRDKEVFIITISDQTNNGKDFIISFIINLAEKLFNASPLNYREHKEEYDATLHSASLSSVVRISNPYILTLNSAKQIALFIIDADIGHDNALYNKCYFIIQSLCLALSSCYILVTPDNVDQSILSTLETKILISKSFSILNENVLQQNKPFNKLAIIILSANTTDQQYNDLDQRGDKLLRFFLRDSNDKTRKFTIDLFDRHYESIHWFLLKSSVNNADRDFDGKFKTYILSILVGRSRRGDALGLTGHEFKNKMMAYTNLFNQNSKTLLTSGGYPKNISTLSYSILKNTYMEKMKDLHTELNFVGRTLLISQHNKLVIEMLNNLFFSKDNSNIGNENKLNCIDTLSLAFNEAFERNEERRQMYSDNRLNESCKLFIEKLKTFENSNTFENVETEEFLKTAEQTAKNYYKTIYTEEDETLFADDFKKLQTILEGERNIFEKRVAQKTMAANNAKAILYAVHQYETFFQNVFQTTPNLGLVAFKNMKADKEQEVSDIFSKQCVNGNENTIANFRKDFMHRLSEINAKFEKIIKENYVKSIEHANAELTNAITYYETTIKSYLKPNADEEYLKKFHTLTVNEAIHIFQRNCDINERHLVEKYIADLNNKAHLIFKQLLDELKTMVIEIENDYSKGVSDSLQNYIQNIENLMSEKQFVESEEFSIISNQLSEKVMNDFKIKEWQIIPSYPTYLTKLSTSISEEYIKLFNKNTQTKDKVTYLAQHHCKSLSEKYEDEMYDEIKKISTENEFKVLHEKWEKLLLNELNTLNPFNNKKLLNPYIETVTKNIEKSKVELKQFLKDRVANENTETQILLTEIRLFYREEMNKYYQNTCYISNVNLKKFHDKTIDLILKKFESRKHNQTKVQFRDLINTSLENSFKAITDENSKNVPTIPAIGIDLGTTNTAVAYYKPGANSGKEIILQNEGANTTPSVVAYTEEGEIVGIYAKENTFIDPRNTVYSVKRLIGKKFNEESIQNDMKYLPFKIIGDSFNRPLIEVTSRGRRKTLIPEQVSAKVLSEMKRIAEQHFKTEISNAVITVPAYFNDSQKQATKDAAKIAGFEVLEIIPEPVAAALAFKLKNSDIEKRNVLVYDLGGGTFDVAVLVIKDLDIKLKAINGDNHLGGDDFDNNLIKYCLDEFFAKTNVRVVKDTKDGDRAVYRLKAECEKRKHQLSARKSVTVNIDNFFNKKDLRVDITREIFERINNDLFEKTKTLLMDALEDASMTEDDIDEVILVGGSTRIPKIREILSNIFPNKQLNYTVNADEAVALGAAAQAAVLNGIKAQELGQLKITKITPMTLGIRVLDGTLSRIVERNSKIPLVVTKQNYTTVVDNQTSIQVIVFEGENLMAEDNRELGRFTLRDIPPAAAKEKKMDVTFDIKEDGILFVKAQLQNTDNVQEITIVEHKGRLTDKELQQLIEEERIHQTL